MSRLAAATATATPVPPLVPALDLRRVHRALAHAGITHQQFADAIGMPRPALTNVLLGQRIAGPLTLIRIGYGLRLFAIDESLVVPDA